MDLPEGFSYQIISRSGERMSDGFIVPSYFDGMGVFEGPEGTVIILRNHEILPNFPPSFGPFGDQNQLLRRARRNQVYDRGGDIDPA